MTGPERSNHSIILNEANDMPFQCCGGFLKDAIACCIYGLFLSQTGWGGFLFIPFGTCRRGPEALAAKMVGRSGTLVSRWSPFTATVAPVLDIPLASEIDYYQRTL